MSNSVEPKFKPGDAVTYEIYGRHGTFNGYISKAIKAMGDDTYRYETIAYTPEGQVHMFGTSDYVREAEIRPDPSRPAADPAFLAKDFYRNFEIGERVKYNVGDHEGVSWRIGKVTDIFMNAVNSDSVWDRVRVKVESDYKEYDECSLKDVQYYWLRPGNLTDAALDHFQKIGFFAPF